MTDPDNGIGHDQVRRFYDTEYYAQVGAGAGAGVPWQVRRVAGRLGSLDGSEALDIACGTGIWLSELARRGARIAGIDISSKAVEYCRQQLPEAEIREAVAEQLPFEDGRFDLVTCMGSLEHFLDQPRALREMRRVAKSDATFLILVPNAGFLTRRLGLYRGTGQVAIRETVRSLDEWTTLLCNAGLHVDARWRDLHALSTAWIFQGPLLSRTLRLLQALALPVWPLAWQYQVYFRCSSKKLASIPGDGGGR
jgi:SAM-dependent methyltransferase